MINYKQAASTPKMFRAGEKVRVQNPNNFYCGQLAEVTKDAGLVVPVRINNVYFVERAIYLDRAE